MATREVINGKSVVENLEFADYNSLEASCRDYTWPIANGTPYRAAWEQYRKRRDLHAPITGASVPRVYATGNNLFPVTSSPALS